MSRKIPIIILTVAVVLILCLFLFEKPIKRRRPDIVLVTLEATRADHLPCYGYSRNTTPGICNLAKDGVLFKNAFSNSANTATSIPTILASKLPYKFHTYSHRHEFTEKNVLFNYLRNEGYRVSFYSNFLNEEIRWVNFDVKDRKDPLEMNEDVVDELDSRQKPQFTWIHYRHNHFPYKPGENFNGTYSNSSGVNQKVIEEIYEGAGKIEGAHRKTRNLSRKYNISREIRYISNKYDEYLRESDYIIRDLIGKLKSKGEYKDALIVLTSDHGECLGKHGNYFEHRELYDPSIEIPLIIKFPDNKYRNRTIENQVSAVNLYKTFMDYLNYTKYKVKDLDGQSLLKTLKGEWEKEDVVSRWVHLFSLRTEKHKYILRTREENEELYNLKKDGEERSNLIKKMELPRKAKEFKKTIEENEDSWKTERGGEKVPEGLKERLKEMGYLKNKG